MFFRLCPMDLSSPTRDQTLIPCSGSTESKPLDHQGSFHASFLNIYLLAVLGLCYYTDFSLRQAGATLQLWFAGFSLRYILLLQSTGCRHMGSVVVVLRLQSIGSLLTVAGKFPWAESWDDHSSLLIQFTSLQHQSPAASCSVSENICPACLGPVCSCLKQGDKLCTSYSVTARNRNPRGI